MRAKTEFSQSQRKISSAVKEVQVSHRQSDQSLPLENGRMAEGVGDPGPQQQRSTLEGSTRAEIGVSSQKQVIDEWRISHYRRRRLGNGATRRWGND